MSHSNRYENYILDQLMLIGVIQTSQLYGGTLLKSQNKQLGLILQGVLYFKVKELELQKKFEKLESEQLEYVPADDDKTVVSNYWWSVPEEIVSNKEQLVGLAYEVLLQGS